MVWSRCVPSEDEWTECKRTLIMSAAVKDQVRKRNLFYFHFNSCHRFVIISIQNVAIFLEIGLNFLDIFQKARKNFGIPSVRDTDKGSQNLVLNLKWQIQQYEILYFQMALVFNFSELGPTVVLEKIKKRTWQYSFNWLQHVRMTQIYSFVQVYELPEEIFWTLNYCQQAAKKEKGNIFLISI